MVPILSRDYPYIKAKKEWESIVDLNAKFYSWCKKHLTIHGPSATEILYSQKRDRRLIMMESHFTTLKTIARTLSIWMSNPLKLKLHLVNCD